MEKKSFAKAVEQALRKNGVDAIRKKSTFYQMAETLPKDYDSEKKYLYKYADGQWVQICSRAADSDPRELKGISREAVRYLCDKTDIELKAARHISKGLVVGIAARSQNLSVDDILQSVSGSSWASAQRASDSEGKGTQGRGTKAGMIGGFADPDTGRDGLYGGCRDAFAGPDSRYGEEYEYVYEDEYSHPYDSYAGQNTGTLSGRRRPLVIAAAVMVAMMTAFGAVFASGGLTKTNTTAEVPDFVGMTMSEAEDRAEEEGFELEKGDQIASRSVQVGYIAQQSEEPGEVIEKETVITVNISSGPNSAQNEGVIEVKDEDKDKEAKKKEQEDAGISCENISYVFPNTDCNGGSAKKDSSNGGSPEKDGSDDPNKGCGPKEDSGYVAGGRCPTCGCETYHVVGRPGDDCYECRECNIVYINYSENNSKTYNVINKTTYNTYITEYIIVEEPCTGSCGGNCDILDDEPDVGFVCDPTDPVEEDPSDEPADDDPSEEPTDVDPSEDPSGDETVDENGTDGDVPDDEPADEETSDDEATDEENADGDSEEVEPADDEYIDDEPVDEYTEDYIPDEEVVDDWSDEYYDGYTEEY